MSPVATIATPADQWLAAMAQLNRARPYAPNNPAWLQALQETRRLAPIIPPLSKDGKKYAEIALYLYQRNPSIIKTYNDDLSLVERQDWNEHIIRFPYWFPEELIRLSLNDDRLWSLWNQGNQWVSEQCGAIGPAAAGGSWSDWWNVSDCDWP